PSAGAEVFNKQARCRPSETAEKSCEVHSATVNEGVSFAFDEPAAIKLAQGVILRVQNDGARPVLNGVSLPSRPVTPLHIFGSPSLNIERTLVPNRPAHRGQRARKWQP